MWMWWCEEISVCSSDRGCQSCGLPEDAASMCVFHFVHVLVGTWLAHAFNTLVYKVEQLAASHSFTVLHLMLFNQA